MRTKKKNKKDVLIIGGGGREHALAWALRRSPQVGDLFYAASNDDGNPAMDLLPNTDRTSQLSWEVDDLRAFAEIRLPYLTIVGPEQPLALGLADIFRKVGLCLEVVGPGKAGAQLETSKQWAKDFMQRWQIPTAHSESFTELARALDYLQTAPAPFVLKADGLAAGKGVLVTSDLIEAQAFAGQVLEQKIFGEAGARLLIEEFLQGMEVSVLALCDTVSNTIIPLEPACDYKRAYDGDAGPNTGGMGAYSPTFIMTPTMRERIRREVLEPTLGGLRAENIDYRGIVYAGLMITSNGPKVLEYNCRMGDPETQSLLPRLKTDLFNIFELLAYGRLNQAPSLEWDERVSCGVVLAAPGYPGQYPKGLPIHGLENFSLSPSPDDFLLFHAGTARQDDNSFGTALSYHSRRDWFPNIPAPHLDNDNIIQSSFLAEHPLQTNGGRVFNLVALGKTMTEARQRVYNTLSENKFGFEGMMFRHDIAERETD